VSKLAEEAFVVTLHWLEAARRRNWLYRHLWLECILS